LTEDARAGCACQDLRVDVLTQELGKVTLGIVGAGVVAVISPVFRTSRRLREDLRHESELLEHLPPRSRAELRAEIARRVYVLVALTKYPPVTRVDVLAWGTWAVCAVAAVSFAITAPVDFWGSDWMPIFSSLAPGVLLAIGAFFASYRPWARRARRRVLYVQQHIGQDEAVVVARMVRVGNVVLACAPVVLAGAVLSPAIVAIYRTLPSPWIMPVTAAFAVSGAVGLAISVAKAGDQLHLHLSTVISAASGSLAAGETANGTGEGPSPTGGAGRRSLSPTAAGERT
jgi:hypothetical protein